MEKATFQPAKDANGEPMASYWMGSPTAFGPPFGRRSQRLTHAGLALEQPHGVAVRQYLLTHRPEAESSGPASATARCRDRSCTRPGEDRGHRQTTPTLRTWPPGEPAAMLIAAQHPSGFGLVVEIGPEVTPAVEHAATCDHLALSARANDERTVAVEQPAARAAAEAQEVFGSALGRAEGAPGLGFPCDGEECGEIARHRGRSSSRSVVRTGGGHSPLRQRVDHHSPPARRPSVPR